MKPFLTIKEIKEKLEKKEISSKEILNFYLNRIKKYDNQLDSCLEVFDQDSIIEKHQENNQSSLNNIPCIIKDNICQKDRIASCASKILSNFKASYDATVTSKIKNSGSFILGRANMDEFAMGSSGEYSAYKTTKNPWDKTRVPGGSSSGAAAAVAAGLVPFALGSETGGSVRQPSSYCNLVGLYPTYGLHSRYGLIAFASSTDQVGPITKTVYDNAIVASALSGHDPKDSTSLNLPKIDYTKNLTGRLPENFTIGVIQDSIDSDGVNPEIKDAFIKAIKQLESLGAKIKYIKLPTLKYGNSTYFIVSRAEAASNLARYDGTLYGARTKEFNDLFDMYVKTRHDGFGNEVKRRILMGNFVLSSKNREAFYNRADKVRSVIRAELDNAFKDVTLLASPTSSILPFKIGEMTNDPIAMYMADYFTVINCITGNPALSFQAGFSKNNLPIGIQFIGPRLSESIIYQAAHAYQISTDHHLKNPENFL